MSEFNEDDKALIIDLLDCRIEGLEGEREGNPPYHAGDRIEWGHCHHLKSAIEALQAEAGLGAKIEKLTARGYMVVFTSPLDLEEQHRYGGDLNCRIIRSTLEGQGYGDTPLQALNNAIDALGEMEE